MRSHSRQMVLAAVALWITGIGTCLAGPQDVLAQEAGIAAYFRAGRQVNLSFVRDVLRTVESEPAEYLIGTLSLPGRVDQYSPHVYASADGWVVAYFLRGDPPSKIVDLANYDGSSSPDTKLDIALSIVGEAIGVSPDDIRYYDFSAPEATRLLASVDVLSSVSSNVLRSGRKDESFSVLIPEDIAIRRRSYVFRSSTRSAFVVGGTTLAEVARGEPGTHQYGDIPLGILGMGSTHTFRMQANGNDPANAFGVPYMAGAVCFVYVEPPRVVPSGDEAGVISKALTPPRETDISPADAPRPSVGGALGHIAIQSSAHVAGYALLVGANAYEHQPNLVNPIVDVQAIAAELRDAYGFDTQVLLDPARADFRAALRMLAQRDYSEHEELLVFISGHGYFDEIEKMGYLAFTDTKTRAEDPFYDTYLSHGTVRTILERLDCDHVLLLVDSCFGGTLDRSIAMAPSGGRRGGDGAYPLATPSELVARKLAYRTRRWITAGGNEYVPDGRPGEHSPFARQVLTALRTFGGADGVLTLEEMQAYIEKAKPQPRFGELLGNEPGSSFVFVTQTSVPATSVARPEPLGTVNVYLQPAARVWLEPIDAPVKGFVQVDGQSAFPYVFHAPAGRYLIRAERDGYEPHAGEIDVGLEELVVHIALTVEDDNNE